MLERRDLHSATLYTSSTLRRRDIVRISGDHGVPLEVGATDLVTTMGLRRGKGQGAFGSCVKSYTLEGECRSECVLIHNVSVSAFTNVSI